jgi:hypothetical protein
MQQLSGAAAFVYQCSDYLHDLVDTNVIACNIVRTCLITQSIFEETPCSRHVMVTITAGFPVAGF